MKTTIDRLLSALRSTAGKFTLLALVLCLPMHAAFAQNSISIASGDNQSGNTFTQLANPLTVSFSGSASTVILDWQVNGDAFFQSTGSSSLQQTLSTSPGSLSGANLDLGGTVGQLTVTVTCSQGCTGVQFVTFKVNVNMSPPHLQMLIFSGNNQSGAQNSTLPLPLTVKTIVGAGNDVPNVTLTWRVTFGTATFTNNHSTTFTQSVPVNTQAQVSLDLGATPGPVNVRVTCAECDAGAIQRFQETINSPTLQVVSGNGQSGAIGTQAAVPLVVQLGSGGTGLSQPVTWSVISGQALLSANLTTTDANGQARITFTYGSTPGPITIQATAPNTQVTFNESSFVPNTTVLSGNNQTAAVGSALQPFTIQLTAPSGSSGTGLGQIMVNWSVVQGGGTLAAATTLTDSTGKSSNTLTLGPNAGTNIVQATIAGVGTISFTAVATAGTVGVPGGSQFTIVSGNNQALVPLQASQPMLVKLVNGQGQPIVGEPVQWSVSGSSGTLTSATTPTDATGQAQNQLTVVLPGSYTVTAKLADAPTVPPLNFSFNNAVANLPALSPTQTSVAHAIDKACPALAAMSSLTTAQQDLLQRCSEIVVASGNNAQQVPNALTQMLNNKALPQNQLANSVQQSQFGNLNTRLAELRQGAMGISLHGLTLANDGQSLPLAMLGDAFHKDPKQADDEVGKDFERWGFFATGMVVRGGFSADSGRPGFDFHNASLTAGVDYRFSDAFVAGGALGYNSSNSSLDQNFGKIDVDSYSVSGYFTWYHNNDFYIEGSVVVDWLNYDLNRNIAYQIASLSGSGLTTVSNSTSASPDGHQTALSLSIGKDFSRGAWTISPYLRGDYTHVNLSAFNETVDDPNSAGAGLGTSVESRSLNSELVVLGSRFSRTTSFDWGVLVPNATIEWNHQLKNDPQVLVTRFLADPTQTPIVITSDAPDQDYFNVGLGLNAVLPKGRSGYLLWEHLVGYAGAHENRFSLGIRIEF
jgi:outer membrane autotransporter protein